MHSGDLFELSKDKATMYALNANTKDPTCGCRLPMMNAILDFAHFIIPH